VSYYLTEWLLDVSHWVWLSSVSFCSAYAVDCSQWYDFLMCPSDSDSGQCPSVSYSASVCPQRSDSLMCPIESDFEVCPNDSDSAVVSKMVWLLGVSHGIWFWSDSYWFWLCTGVHNGPTPWCVHASDSVVGPTGSDPVMCPHTSCMYNTLIVSKKSDPVSCLLVLVLWYVHICFTPWLVQQRLTATCPHWYSAMFVGWSLRWLSRGWSIPVWIKMGA
jgi:hypothetical protein